MRTIKNCERMRCCELRRESVIDCEDCILKDTCETRKNERLMTERNALKELAETLKFHIEPRRLNADKDEFAVAICKSQRIIAELAMVKLNGVGWAERIELADAYEKCRAIAEEGAKDEH